MGLSEIRIFQLSLGLFLLLSSMAHEQNKILLNNQSSVQSLTPGNIPSVSSSFIPTPSFLPSNIPSNHVPTTAPLFASMNGTSPTPTRLSSSPSIVPSVMPTATCHDVQSYRSPINNLECSDHKGTDCIQWRHLGLNVNELEDLVNFCPESCNIDCGALSRFELRLTYRLENVITFLGPETSETIELVGVEFFTKYIQSITPQSRIFVNEAELLRQQIEPYFLGQREHALRTSQSGPYVELLIETMFRGLTVHLTTDALLGYLEEAILSTGFTQAIQGSGDPTLTQAIVSDHKKGRRFSPNAGSTAGNDDNRHASGSVVASMLMAFAAICAGVCLFVWHKRKVRTENGDRGVNEPSAVSPTESERSQLTNIFSFESVSNAVANAKGAVLNVNFCHQKKNSTKNTPSRSSTSESGSGETEDEPHPLAGLIPPMIVMNQIDSDEDSIRGSRNAEKIANVVPSHYMAASAQLIASLNDRRTPHQVPNFSKVFVSVADFNAKENEDDLEKQVAWLIAPNKGNRSFHIFSSEDNDDEDIDGIDSVSSYPAEASGIESPSIRQTMDDGTAFRKLIPSASPVASLK